MDGSGVMRGRVGTPPVSWCATRATPGDRNDNLYGLLLAWVTKESVEMSEHELEILKVQSILEQISRLQVDIENLKQLLNSAMELRDYLKPI